MSLSAQSLLAVASGGALGAASRYAVVVFCAQVLGSSFPWGTLAVNVVGSLLMGVMFKWFLVSGELSENLRLFLTTGFLGGFTTFSAFSLDAVGLVQQSAYSLSLLYVMASVIASVLALWFGFIVFDLLSSWLR